MSKQQNKKQNKKPTKGHPKKSNVSGPTHSGPSKTKQKVAQKEHLKHQVVYQYFMNFYSKQWGDRWNQLLMAMEQPTKYCLFLNLFADPTSYQDIFDLSALEPLSFLSIPTFSRNLQDAPQPPGLSPPSPEGPPTDLPLPESALLPFPPPCFDDNNIFNYYCLDAASLLVTEALQVTPNDKILDVCAAPGGKSLATIQRMFHPHLSAWPDHLPCTPSPSPFLDYLHALRPVEGSLGSLTCNDISPSRVARLKKIIHSYVPKEYRAAVTVTQKDATHPNAFNSGAFTKILIDAPCSSERHLVCGSAEAAGEEQESLPKDSESDSFGSDSDSFESPKSDGPPAKMHNIDNYSPEFFKWTLNRSRNNAHRQLAILRNCLAFLSEGGLLVYATCSISQLENDGVIQKILSKSKWELECERREWKIGEATKYGWMVTPDKEGGWGPLYFCILRKGPQKPKKGGQEDSD